MQSLRFWIKWRFKHIDKIGSSLRSSSFLQVTLAPSWWSIRRRCTSLQTAGRRGDRYITSSCLTLVSHSRLLSLCTEDLSVVCLLNNTWRKRSAFHRLEMAPLTLLCCFLLGFWGGASHPLPWPRRGHRSHQGHLHPPQDTQVRILFGRHVNSNPHCSKTFLQHKTRVNHVFPPIF